MNTLPPDIEPHIQVRKIHPMGMTRHLMGSGVIVKAIGTTKTREVPDNVEDFTGSVRGAYDDIIAEILAEQAAEKTATAEASAKAASAIATLERLGYEHAGGEDWRSPPDVTQTLAV